MKRFLITFAALSLLFGLVSGANASLLGDEVWIQYVEADVTYFWNPVKVANDNSDAIRTGWNAADGFGKIQVDLGETGVQIDFLASERFSSSSQFFGLTLSGLDFGDEWVLLGVDVDTDMVGWTDDRISYFEDKTGAYHISFDWQGLSFAGSLDEPQSFTAMFDLGPSPIPIPATMALFVTGLVGFMFIRRRIKP